MESLQDLLKVAEAVESSINSTVCDVNVRQDNSLDVDEGFMMSPTLSVSRAMSLQLEQENQILATESTSSSSPTEIMSNAKKYHISRPILLRRATRRSCA